MPTNAIPEVPHGRVPSLSTRSSHPVVRRIRHPPPIILVPGPIIGPITPPSSPSPCPIIAAPGLFIADNMARSSPSGLEGVMIGCSHILCPRTRTIITKAVVPISLAPFPSSPSQGHLRTTMLSPNVMGEIVTLFPMASHVAPLSWLVSLNLVMSTSRNNSMPQIIFHQNSLIDITVVCVERETIGLDHVSMGCLSNALHAMPMAINPSFVMLIMEMFHMHRGAAKKGCHLSAICTWIMSMLIMMFQWTSRHTRTWILVFSHLWMMKSRRAFAYWWSQ